MRDIDNIHYTENKRKSAGQKKKDRRKGKTAERLNNKKIHQLPPFIEVPKLTDNLFSVSFKKLKDKAAKKSEENKTENHNIVNRIC